MRLRLFLLLPGLLLMFLELTGWSMPMTVQFGIFLVGLLTLGVPHGAADVLVADYVGRKDGNQFSMLNFLGTYLGRIMVFGILLWVFP